MSASSSAFESVRHSVFGRMPGAMAACAVVAMTMAGGAAAASDDIRPTSVDAARPAAAAAAAAAAAVAANVASAAPSAATPVAVISAGELLSRLHQPWFQLIDLRTADEYAGRDLRAIRGGHIPGALNLSVADAADRLNRFKETVAYAHDPSDALAAAQALQAQGFQQVKVLSVSWPQWAGNFELPVASEHFVDVEALREQIRLLRSQLAQAGAGNMQAVVR